MSLFHSRIVPPPAPPVLCLDLDAGNWNLAFTVRLGQKPRLKTITARSTLSLVLEV